MQVEAIAKRLSREHFELEILMRRLLECVDYLPRTNETEWIEIMRRVWGEFRRHLLKHLDLEEADGYMGGVIERRPAVAGEVDRLLVEHASLRYLINSITDDVARLTPTEPLRLRDICHRIRDLIAYIRHHEHDENMMVLSAYTDDYGAGD